uniref:FYVE-type domain-containing protein n=1 Tax=Eptatretus burgeri TaxID=7764 RepID=A0A8C4QVB0_EPTBU
EKMQKLLEIHELLDGEVDIVHPSNELIKEGPIFKLSARNGVPQERHLFLVRTSLWSCVVVDDMKNEEASTFSIYGKQRLFELGKRAPQWIRDMDATMCMKCKELFNTITRRRHHCRACGHVVCAKCSESRHYLEYEPSKPQRVCKECYAHLTSNYGQGNALQQKEKRILEQMDGAFPNESSIMSGFLQFFERGGRPTWQKAWFTLPKSDPLVLYMYGAQQDVKALNTFSLPGYEVRKLEPEDTGENRRPQTQLSTRYGWPFTQKELKDQEDPKLPEDPEELEDPKVTEDK